MERPKEDRRVRRTRRLLKQGLAELMREKEFKDITVKDITERVDLNRGTFYLHYTDTYDLLEKLENETLDDFQQMFDENCSDLRGDSFLPIINPVVSYVVENADICRSLFENKASGNFMKKFHHMVYENGTAVMRERLPQVPQAEWDYFLSFVIYGLLGVIQNWYNSGMRLGQSALVRLCNDMVTAAAGCLVKKEGAPA